jgi:hypothetical protein
MRTLLEHVYFLKKQRTKYASIFLEETLQPHVKFANSSRNVYQIQWFILVTFKSHTKK